MVIVGFIAAAGTKVFGGSYAVKKSALQLLNQSTSFNLLGMAMKGRYGSPSSGLYQFSSY